MGIDGEAPESGRQRAMNCKSVQWRNYTAADAELRLLVVLTLFGQNDVGGWRHSAKLWISRIDYVKFDVGRIRRTITD